MSDLHNTSELMAKLEGMAIHTTQGSFLKVEDVRRLIGEKQEGEAIEAAEPAPKTMIEAKRMAAESLKKQGFGQKQPSEPSRAIPATEPQPSSRT